jgi:hypothetical protein
MKKSDVAEEGVGDSERREAISCRSAGEMLRDVWVAVSMGIGSSVNFCGLIEEVIDSDSTDGFWMLKITLVEDPLRFSRLAGGLNDSCVWEDEEGATAGLWGLIASSSA